MSIDAKQILEHVVTPVLDSLGMGGKDATALVMGTAAVESDFRYIAQIRGPANGLWQMEPATYRDIWNHWLAYKTDVMADLLQWGPPDMHRRPDLLTGNLFLACGMCRIHYRRDRFPLPSHDDAIGLAKYHKRVYNTSLGKTRVEDSVVIFERIIREMRSW